jgi:hypothetical protein
MVAKVFIDQPPTTNKGRDRRPGQMALLEAIRVGSVERVLLYSIDRVARTLAELVNFIETCRSCGIGLYLHEQHLDTAASNGISLFDLAGMMALHVRQSRRERILRGQAAARAASVRFGRPYIVGQEGEGKAGACFRQKGATGGAVGGNIGSVGQQDKVRIGIMHFLLIFLILFSAFSILARFLGWTLSALFWQTVTIVALAVIAH